MGSVGNFVLSCKEPLLGTELVRRSWDYLNHPCAKVSLTGLAGESPAIEGEPIPLCSESCVIVGNENDEA